MPTPAWPAYWNPKNETLSRVDLKSLQLIKLQRTVARAYATSAFHRRLYDQAKVRPQDIKSLDDIRRLPFMTREDWMACQAEKPLFGDMITRPPEDAIRYHLTSGTSGRQPLRVLDSRKDWSWIGEMWCYGFWGFGVRPADTVFFAFSYGSFIGFWGAHYGCEKIGCLVLPSGNMTTDNRVKQLVEMGATTVCATPTYALRMAHLCEGEPEGRTGVHEFGVWKTPPGNDPLRRAPGFLPTIAFQDDTLVRSRDAVEAAIAAAASE